MANTIHVDIVSAEASIYQGDVEMVIASGEMGELGIVAKHTPLLTMLRPGQVRLIKSSQPLNEEIYYISGGILEVQPKVVTILADTIARAEDLDEAQAIKAQESARRQMQDRQTDVDYTKAAAELAQAAAKIQAIQKLRKIRK